MTLDFAIWVSWAPILRGEMVGHGESPACPANAASVSP